MKPYLNGLAMGSYNREPNPDPVCVVLSPGVFLELSLMQPGLCIAAAAPACPSNKVSAAAAAGLLWLPVLGAGFSFLTLL